MRLILLAAGIIFLLATCRKDVTSIDSITRLKMQLRDSMPPATFAQLNFDSVFDTRAGDEHFIRVGFSGKALPGDFVLIHRGDDGNYIKEGRVISIAGTVSNDSFNGFITINYLSGTRLLDHSPVVDGYIQWHRGDIRLKEMVVPGADGKVLPEVILISTIKPSTSSSAYYLLPGIAGGGSYGSSGYYSGAASVATGSSGAAPGNTTKPTGISAGKTDKAGSTTGVKDDAILVDFERAVANPAINIEDYIKCFSNVPDAGATCSIEILTDIPVDSDPTRLFDWKTESPGHTFLQIKKSNGSQSVVQNIGFYPNTDWKSISTPSPVAAKFVDNSNHEFNASLKMSVSPDNLKATLNQVLYLAKFVKYDIDEYNCTDFALEIFNYRRQETLVIPKIDLPSAGVPGGSSSPQGLYMKLKEIKTSGGVDAANVNIGFVKAYVGNGNGPCH